MSTLDVLVSGATVLYSDTGTALPDETSVGFNAYGSWSSWTTVGETATPVGVDHSKSYYAYETQQRSYATDMRTVARSTSVNFAVDELSGAMLALLLDGTNTATGAGAGQKAYNAITWGSNITTTTKQWAFEGYRLDSAGTQQPVRFFFYKAVLSVAGEFVFNKGNHTVVPCTLYCMADTSKTAGQDVGLIHLVTAPASS